MPTIPTRSAGDVLPNSSKNEEKLLDHIRAPFLIEWEGLKRPLPFDCLCLFSNGPEGLETLPSNSMVAIFKP